MKLTLLADPVEDNDGRVDGVSDDGQHTCDKCIAHGYPGDHVERQHHEHIMHQGDDRAGCEADIFEAEPDVQQHTDRRDDHGHDRIGAHLGTYGRADVLGMDVRCGNTVVLFHIVGKCFTLLQIL